jgi:small subunit ribosomal protein S17
MPRRVLEGVVVSDVCSKTIMVKVERSFKHPIYKKYLSRSKKYAAHDPENIHKVGDMVKIIEGRPMSKTKKWYVWNGATVPYNESLKT